MILTHDELRLARINHSHTGRAASAEILALLDHIDAQTERIAALEAFEMAILALVDEFTNGPGRNAGLTASYLCECILKTRAALTDGEGGDG